MAHEETEARRSFTHRAPVPIVASADGDADDNGPRQASFDTPFDRPIDAPSDLQAELPSGEVPPLPHWTEPPTGAVPAIFADDTGEHSLDDLDAWAPITGSTPRFRAEGSDWAEADFGDDLGDEDERLGALSEAEPVDEEAEFAEALAQRRRRLPRAPRRSRRGRGNRRGGAASAAAPSPRPPRRAAPLDPDAANGGPTPARDLPTAIMTAATIVIVALVCFTLGATATTVVAAVIIGVAIDRVLRRAANEGVALGDPARARRRVPRFRSR